MRQVILVDDEYWALKGMETLFPWADYAFEIAGSFDNPVMAFDAICDTRPDLVVTDIRMPEMSGLDLLGLSRQRDVGSLFVMISGYSEFEYAREALRHGAFDYILKPITFEDAAGVLARIDARLANGADAPEPPILSSNQQLNDLLRYVRTHFRERLQLKELAAQFHLNPTYCSELFGRTTGMAFTKYVNQLRIERCCTLLSHTAMPIDEIAYDSGFSDYSHFHKVFKAAYGVSPLQYRKGGGLA